MFVYIGLQSILVIFVILVLKYKIYTLFLFLHFLIKYSKWRRKVTSFQKYQMPRSHLFLDRFEQNLHQSVCFDSILTLTLTLFLLTIAFPFKGKNDFSFQLRKFMTRYRCIGYNLNVMRQSACLVFNPIMVDNYAAFFHCTSVGRASDYDGLDFKLFILFGWGRSFLSVAWPTGVQLVFFFCSGFQ